MCACVWVFVCVCLHSDSIGWSWGQSKWWFVCMHLTSCNYDQMIWGVWCAMRPWAKQFKGFPRNKPRIQVFFVFEWWRMLKVRTAFGVSLHDPYVPLSATKKSSLPSWTSTFRIWQLELQNGHGLRMPKWHVATRSEGGSLWPKCMASDIWSSQIFPHVHTRAGSHLSSPKNMGCLKQTTTAIDGSPMVPTIIFQGCPRSNLREDLRLDSKMIVNNHAKACRNHNYLWFLIISCPKNYPKLWRFCKSNSSLYLQLLTLWQGLGHVHFVVSDFTHHVSFNRWLWVSWFRLLVVKKLDTATTNP